jgi:hypothetical protein
MLYFQVHPDYNHAKPAMLEYAENTFRWVFPSGKDRCLTIFINEYDHKLQVLARERTFHKLTEHTEVSARYLLDKPIPSAKLPLVFNIQNLADNNDLHKINHILWRGFDHKAHPKASIFSLEPQRLQTSNYLSDTGNTITMASTKNNLHSTR